MMIHCLNKHGDWMGQFVCYQQALFITNSGYALKDSTRIPVEKYNEFNVARFDSPELYNRLLQEVPTGRGTYLFPYFEDKKELVLSPPGRGEEINWETLMDAIGAVNQTQRWTVFFNPADKTLNTEGRGLFITHFYLGGDKLDKLARIQPNWNEREFTAYSDLKFFNEDYLGTPTVVSKKGKDGSLHILLDSRPHSCLYLTLLYAEKKLQAKFSIGTARKGSAIPALYLPTTFSILSDVHIRTQISWAVRAYMRHYEPFLRELYTKFPSVSAAYSFVELKPTEKAKAVEIMQSMVDVVGWDYVEGKNESK